MKKSLVALAVVAAVPAFAQAQTSIQLTGSVDVAVESLNKEASSSGKSDLQINDGIWGGSKVGIVGSEELGNGLKAIFNLEYEANADNGRLADSSRFWSESWVGLNGGFGTVKLGRQDSPIKGAIESGDVTGQSWYYSSDGLAGIVDKVDNSISYATPSMGGLTLAVAYASGEATAPAGNDRLNKLNDAYSVGLLGDWGSFRAGVGYQSIDGAKINNIKRTQQIAASIGTKLGDFGAGLGYGQSQVKAETGSNPAKNKAYYASFSYAVSDAGTVYLNYLRSEEPNTANQLLKDKENGLGLTYAHGLSKRTYVYGTVGIGKAEVPGQDDTKPRRVALGVRHFF
mgnify:CR=1 FL=1